MTTYYVDPINGNDAYDGLTWGTAKKSLTGGFTYTVFGDEVRVAKNLELDLGAIQVTNASAAMYFTSIGCIPLDNGGGISATWVNGTTYNTITSAYAGGSVTIPSGQCYIVVNGGTAITSISLNGGSNITTRGRLNRNEVFNYATSGSDNTLQWFDIGTGNAGTLNSLQLNGSSGTSSAWLVYGLPSQWSIATSSLTVNNGLRIAGSYNHVVGPDSASQPLLSVKNWTITNTGSAAYLTAEAAMNWAGSSATYSKSIWGTTFEYTVAQNISVPFGVSLYGGCNTSTGVQDGVTRLQGVNNTFSGSTVYCNLQSTVDVVLRLGSKQTVSGFGMYNFRWGAYIDLNAAYIGNPSSFAAVQRTYSTNILLQGTQGGTATAGLRYLVIGQTTQADNGIYIAAAGNWSRASDLNEDSEAVVGKTVYDNNSLRTYYIDSKTGTLGGGGSILTFAQVPLVYDTTVLLDGVANNGAPNQASGGGLNVLQESWLACPVNVYVKYRTHGPNMNNSNTNWGGSNNGIKPEWSVNLRNNCTGWGDGSGNGATYIAPSFGFASANEATITEQLRGGFVRLLMSLSTSMGTEWKFGHIRSGAFTSAGTTASQGSLARDRGMPFASTNTTGGGWSLRRAMNPFAWFSSNETVGASTVAVARGVVMADTQATAAGLTTNYDKGFAFTPSFNSGVVWSFAPVIRVAWDAVVSSAASITSFLRDRGYAFTSVNDQPVTAEVAVARPVALSSATVSGTIFGNLLRIKELALDAIVVNSAVASIATYQNKTVQAAINLLNTTAVSIATSRPITLASATISQVAQSIGRSRPVTWAASVVSGGDVAFTRIKDMAWGATASLVYSPFIRKSTSVAWTAVQPVLSVFANNTIVSWAASTTSLILSSFGRSRPAALTVAELATSTFGQANVSRDTALTVTESSSSSLSLLRDRGYAFTIPMSLTMQANLARLVGNQFAAQMNPVISVVLGRSMSPAFTVIGTVGNVCTVKLNQAFDFVIGEVVTVDGHILVARPNSTSWGAASTTSSAVGVSRGVRFDLTEQSEVLNTVGRLVSLGFTSRSEQQVGVSGNSNRLDQFFVQFEQPISETLLDGSIILGKKRVVSSGILHEQHPEVSVTIPAPETYTITVQEDD